MIWIQLAIHTGYNTKKTILCNLYGPQLLNGEKKSLKADLPQFRNNRENNLNTENKISRTYDKDEGYWINKKLVEEM